MDAVQRTPLPIEDKLLKGNLFSQADAAVQLSWQ
jgi:hypothetical protein